MAAQLNWEALEVALQKLKIATIAGRTRVVQEELIYLLDNLGKLADEMQRTTEDEVCT